MWLSQDSSLSPILYLFHNVDFIEIGKNPDNGTITSGFVDNVAILAIGGQVKENLKILLQAHGKVIDWTNTQR